MSNDQTCRHGYHECNVCRVPFEIHITSRKSQRGEYVLALTTTPPRAGQILVAKSPTEIEWQDPPGVVRSEN
jgi:hypothetical protein